MDFGEVKFTHIIVGAGSAAVSYTHLTLPTIVGV